MTNRMSQNEFISQLLICSASWPFTSLIKSTCSLLLHFECTVEGNKETVIRNKMIIIIKDLFHIGPLQCYQLRSTQTSTRPDKTVNGQLTWHILHSYSKWWLVIPIPNPLLNIKHGMSWASIPWPYILSKHFRLTAANSVSKQTSSDKVI